MSDKVLIKFKPLDSAFEMPVKGSAKAAGFDMRACIPNNVVLMPGVPTLIPLGCAVEIPEGFEIQVRPRSGLALKYGVTVLNAPGTIDSDYRGPCGVIMINASKDAFTVTPGMRICQFVVAAVPEVELELVTELSKTERGEGGFGSTGLQ